MTQKEKDLRDQYAGMAMQSIIQSKEQMDVAEVLSDKGKIDGEAIELQEAVAIMAFTQAEFMMQVRQKIDEANQNNNGEEK